ncbi:MAG: tRNA pseudouridine(38-40) synthase TruA [Planctomycetes bacterium]|nr:tRNA pseudouridine(38-40) synthase TruA [Planctomycetota bacterium]
MRNVRVLVAYDGARFFGWQRQDGFDSVQQALEEALLAATGARATVHGAGRTDTGVHALGQVAHFHVETRLDDDRLRHALNAHLPPGVVVREAETCADDFHARFSARSKRYAYQFVTTRFRPAAGAQYAHWTSWPLDVPRMRRAARALLGTHDFAAFGNAGSPRTSTVRTVQHLRFVARRERLCFVIQGDGFLYNMVRTIAGTLLDVGRGKLGEDAPARALASRERDDAGPTAPACGLHLVSVQYRERPFAGRRPRA